MSCFCMLLFRHFAFDHFLESLMSPQNHGKKMQTKSTWGLLDVTLRQIGPKKLAIPKEESRTQHLPTMNLFRSKLLNFGRVSISARYNEHPNSCRQVTRRLLVCDRDLKLACTCQATRVCDTNLIKTVNDWRTRCRSERIHTWFYRAYLKYVFSHTKWVCVSKIAMYTYTYNISNSFLNI